MISAKIIADSVSPQGHRITTFELVFPRMILAELNTHRLFSRNSASSRAIPFSKMVKAVQDNPFIPIAWQKDHKGMQGIEYFTHPEAIETCKVDWLTARDYAIHQAKMLNESGGVTKQLCNRLLEPFMWHKVLLTATEFDNFFQLRCPQYEFPALEGKTYRSKKDVREAIHFANSLSDLEWLQVNKGQSEIHMMALAEAMWDAYNESTPKQLKAGEWHIPYGDTVLVGEIGNLKLASKVNMNDKQVNTVIKISTAKCARVSYTTVGEDGKEIPYEKDIALHDSLIASGHMSPTEHCAKCMSNEEYYSFVKGNINTTSKIGWCNNFKGWIPYRYLLENQ